MDTPPPAEVLMKALRKMAAALQGLGHAPVAIGALAHQAWGSKRGAQGVDLLVTAAEANRDAICSAARGEGLQGPESAQNGTLRMRYTDAKLGATATVDVLEAATPFQKQVLSRAQRGVVLTVQLPLASCEDLILIGVRSDDRDGVIELLRGNAGRIDGQYLKKEAEAAGIFDKLKSAWAEAKK